jgi:Na+/melibiose symporter-like transporter
MLGLATQNDTERTRLSSIRIILGGLAGLCVAGLVALLINGVREVPSQAMISLVVAGLGLVAISGAVFQLIIAGYREPSMVQIDRLPADMVGSIITLPVLVLIFMGMVVAVTAPVFSKLEPYFAAYVLQSVTAGGLVVGATSLGGIVSQPLWVWLSDRVTRKSALQAGGGTMAVGALAFLGVASLGTPQAAACGFVFGAGLGGLGMSIWAALADFTARPTVEGKTPSAAAIFAAFSFASKAALSGSIFLVGWLLSIHPYRIGSNESIWPLLPVMCLLPAAGAGVCIGIVQWLASSLQRSQAGAGVVGHACVGGRIRSDRRVGLETPTPATPTRDRLR